MTPSTAAPRESPTNEYRSTATATPAILRRALQTRSRQRLSREDWKSRRPVLDPNRGEAFEVLYASNLFRLAACFRLQSGDTSDELQILPPGIAPLAEHRQRTIHRENHNLRINDLPIDRVCMGNVIGQRVKEQDAGIRRCHFPRFAEPSPQSGQHESTNQNRESDIGRIERLFGKVVAIKTP